MTTTEAGRRRQTKLGIGACATVASALLFASTALADEPVQRGALVATPTTGAGQPDSRLLVRDDHTTLAVPPYAGWRPLTQTAARSAIIVKPSARGLASARVENRNEFAVTLTDLTLSSVGTAVHREPILLAPGEQRIVYLDPVSDADVPDRLKRARVRFFASVPVEVLDALGHDLTNLDRGGDATVETAIGRAGQATRVALFVERETRLTRMALPGDSSLADDAELVRDRASALAEESRTQICDALVVEAERTRPRVRDFRRVLRTSWLNRGFGMPRSCVSDEQYQAVVNAALLSGTPDHAAALAAALPEEDQRRYPYSQALSHRAAERFDDHWPHDPVMAMADLHEVVDVSYNHPILERRSEVAKALADKAIDRAQQHDFEMAYGMLNALEAEVDKLRAAQSADYEATRELLHWARSEVAYFRGKFLYHYRRQSLAGMAEAHEQFAHAAQTRPMRAALYRGGLVFVEYQFSAILLLVLFAFAVVVSARSSTALRTRMRVHMWRARRLFARGDHHRARESFWKVLSAMLGTKSRSASEQRMHAEAASGVLEVSRALADHHELAEAAALLSWVSPSLRPPAWQDPTELLENLCDSLDRPSVHTRLQKIADDCEILWQVFGGREEVGLTEALLADARARSFAEQRLDASATYHQAINRYEEVASAASPGSLAQRVARCRAGLLAATIGPRVEGIGAWARCHDNLSSCDDTLARPALTARARALASAACASTIDAVACIDEVRHVLVQSPVGRRVLREALLTIARRATVPSRSPRPNDAVHAVRDKGDGHGAIGALARLDNLIVEHVTSPDGLDARLRLALLRRLARADAPSAAADHKYSEDLDDLMTRARAMDWRATTTALACVLDLLTPGDHGFDERAAQAEGAQKKLHDLVAALDAYAHGDTIAAASRLAALEPDAADTSVHTAVRLLLTRATVAAAMNQYDAARAALQRAIDTMATGNNEDDRRAVELTAARLATHRDYAAALTDPQLLDWTVRGLLRTNRGRHPLRPAVPWHKIALALAAAGLEETATLAVMESVVVDGDEVTAQLGRQRALMKLSGRALSRYNPECATRYAKLAATAATKAVLRPKNPDNVRPATRRPGVYDDSDGDCVKGSSRRL